MPCTVFVSNSVATRSVATRTRLYLGIPGRSSAKRTAINGLYITSFCLSLAKCSQMEVWYLNQLFGTEEEKAHVMKA